MNKLLILIGLQGSGKSTWADEYKKYDVKVVSSDKIREEHNWQIDNASVFNEFYKRIDEHLANGYDVIADATNITIKSRRPFFERIKTKCCKIGIVFNTPIEICKRRVERRNQEESQKIVPLEVLEKYMASFQIPFKEEGFDELWLTNPGVFNQDKYIEIVNEMNTFDQKNSHHNYTLGQHSQIVENLIQRSTLNFPVGCGILHDIGKLLTQTFGADGEAHYYNHANVGTYFVASHPELCVRDIFNVLFIINYHMMPFDWKTEKAIKKWTAIFGEKNIELLKTFNNYDEFASKIRFLENF